MLRKLVCALAVLALCVGVTLAGEFTARITKVEGDKVTFTEFTGKEKGDEKTLPVADSVKVVQGKFNPETKKAEAGEPIEKGLKNEMFTKISERGLFGTIVTDADNKKITEIRVLTFKQKEK